MSVIECKTEAQIKQYAKELFFVKGNFNASTQEIADYAGVNRTLVNYYFRSKTNLFEIVYCETISEMRSEFAAIYIAKMDFRAKIERIIDYLFEFRQTYPFLEVFNIQETPKLSNQMDSILNPKYVQELSVFVKEIEEEMEKGGIPKYDPMNFLVNVFSLVSYPIIMRPVFEKVLGLTTADYSALLEKRKKEIIAILFNNRF